MTLVRIFHFNCFILLLLYGIVCEFSLVYTMLQGEEML